MKKSGIWILALAAAVLFTACAAKPAEAQGAEDTARAFLTSFYTADEGERYTSFLSETASAADNEALDAAAEQYRASLAALSTEALADSLVSNRTLSKYDEAHAGQDVQVKSVELDEDDGFYAFTVKIDAGGAEETYTGQISVAEDSGLVDNFHEASRS